MVSSLLQFSSSKDKKKCDDDVRSSEKETAMMKIVSRLVSFHVSHIHRVHCLLRCNVSCQ